MTWAGYKENAYIKGRPVCECCDRLATDAHHWLVGRDKRKQFKALVDKPINMAHLCHECHMAGKGDTRNFKLKKATKLIRAGYYGELVDYLEDLLEAGKQVQEQRHMIEWLKEDIKLPEGSE